MSVKVLSAAVIGLDCELVEVEADNSPGSGQIGIFIVGLPDKAVDESKGRVRSAVKNSGLAFLPSTDSWGSPWRCWDETSRQA